MKFERSISVVVVSLVLLAAARAGYHAMREHAALPPGPAVTTVPYSDNEAKSALIYDYDRMLRLIEQTKKIKDAYHAQFTRTVDQLVHPLSPREVKALLEDLYREKARFDAQVVAVKVFYKGSVPPRRARSLAYYAEVIDGSVKDIERILRRL